MAAIIEAIIVDLENSPQTAHIGGPNILRCPEREVGGNIRIEDDTASLCCLQKMSQTTLFVKTEDFSL